MQGSNPLWQIGIAILLFFPVQWRNEMQNEKSTKQSDTVNQFRVVEHYPLVLIDAQVMSRITGLPVIDLTRSDFVISQNGIGQDIAIWRRYRAPVSLLILIDLMDANGDHNLFVRQIEALKSSLSSWLGATDQASILVIAERPMMLQDFTSNKDLISDALDKAAHYRIGPNEPSQKRITEALQQAAVHKPAHPDPMARNAIILISNLTSADAVILSEKTVRAIVESPTIFCWRTRAKPFALNDVLESREFPIDRVDIGELVRLTGGEFVESDWKSFVDRLRERYRIGYVPLALKDRPNDQVVRIKLELAPGLKLDARNVILIYRRAAVISHSAR